MNRVRDKVAVAAGHVHVRAFACEGARALATDVSEVGGAALLGGCYVGV